MKVSDSSAQYSHLSGNVKSFMASCAAFGKQLPNCSCFCIDSVQRGKASLQLACGFIDHQVPPQLSRSRTHPFYFRRVERAGGGESTCFLLSKDGLGILTAPSFNQPTPRCLCSCIFQPNSLLFPHPCYLCQRAWGGGKSSLRCTRSPESYLLLRASSRLQEPTCLQSLGRGEFQDT